MDSDSSSSDSSLPDKMNYFVKKRKMIHELEKTSDYQELVKRINKNDSGSNLYIQKESNLLSLNDYLSLQEMVPLSPALAAKWIKEICESISYLHNSNYIIGDIDESRVMINEKGVAGILLPPSLYIAPSKDKYSYFLIDTEPIGKMLHRFMSGSSHIPKLKNHSYIVVPELENGLRLATVLLSNSEELVSNCEQKFSNLHIQCETFISCYNQPSLDSKTCRKIEETTDFDRLIILFV